MNGKTLRQTVVVTNPQGFHMRPLTAFAELAGRYACQVTVTKDGKAVNGKSPLDLMLLAAEQGSVLTVETSGPDAEAALAALLELIRDVPHEEEGPERPLPPKG